MNNNKNNSTKFHVGKFSITDQSGALIGRQVVKYFKTITVLTLFMTTLSFGCDANCVNCHPKLLKNGAMDDDHKILNRCTKCHTEEESDNAHGACGADCWSCHDITKVNRIDVPEHRVLPTCIRCHESIDKHLFVPNKDLFSNDTLQTSFSKGT